MKQRNIVVCIILSIVTCGIYGMYWFVKITNEMNELDEEKGTSGGVALLLTLVTCGLYGIYWSYKMGEKVDRVKGSDGGSPVMFLILAIFGLGIVNYCLVQDTLNKYGYVEDFTANAQPETVGEFIEEIAEEAEYAAEEVGEYIEETFDN